MIYEKNELINIATQYLKHSVFVLLGAIIFILGKINLAGLRILFGIRTSKNLKNLRTALMNHFVIFTVKY
jgi:hypothetical protein